MIKDNYMNDPRKLVNTPSFQAGGAQGRDGAFRGGYQGGARGGFRGGRDNRDGSKPYIDHDDPTRYQQLSNPERQIVSYDDLF